MGFIGIDQRDLDAYAVVFSFGCSFVFANIWLRICFRQRRRDDLMCAPWPLMRALKEIIVLNGKSVLA